MAGRAGLTPHSIKTDCPIGLGIRRSTVPLGVRWLWRPSGISITGVAYLPAIRLLSSLSHMRQSIVHFRPRTPTYTLTTAEQSVIDCRVMAGQLLDRKRAQETPQLRTGLLRRTITYQIDSYWHIATRIFTFRLH